MRDVPKLFGSMVFNDETMQARLPEDVYLALKKSMAQGTHLELDVANAVANAMKEWAIEKGATHFTHWFQPMTGITAEKHDSFISLVGSSKVIMGILRKRAGAGRAGRFQLSFGRIALHLRSAGLYRLGSYFVRFYPRKDLVHPYSFLLLQR